MSLPSRRNDKFVNFRPRGEFLVVSQVKLPPWRDKSIRPCLKIKSEKSPIAGEEIGPDLSLGKQETLKSPPIHQGISHYKTRLASTSQSNRWSTSELCPQTQAKAHSNWSMTLLNLQATKKFPTHFDLFHNSPVPNQDNVARYNNCFDLPSRHLSSFLLFILQTHQPSNY